MGVDERALSVKLGHDMGGLQIVWGEENVPENALSRKCLDPSRRASVDFYTEKNIALTPEGGGKRTIRGGVQNPLFGRGVIREVFHHLLLFPPPPWRPLIKHPTNDPRCPLDVGLSRGHALSMRCRETKLHWGTSKQHMNYKQPRNYDFLVHLLSSVGMRSYKTKNANLLTTQRWAKNNTQPLSARGAQEIREKFGEGLHSHARSMVRHVLLLICMHSTIAHAIISRSRDLGRG